MIVKKKDISFLSTLQNLDPLRNKEGTAAHILAGFLKEQKSLFELTVLENNCSVNIVSND